MTVEPGNAATEDSLRPDGTAVLGTAAPSAPPWFAVLAGPVWWSLRRRQACSLAGARTVRERLLGLLLVAVATFVVLYALTSWLERFA